MKATVEMCQEFGASVNEAIHRIAAKFGLSEDVASQHVHKYWRS